MDEEQLSRRIMGQVRDGRSRIESVYLDRGGKCDLTEGEWREILEASAGICFYCHRHFGIENLSIDHVIPLYMGGDHSKTNVVPACLDCNFRRPKPKRMPPKKHPKVHVKTRLNLETIETLTRIVNHTGWRESEIVEIALMEYARKHPEYRKVGE
jgi:5-methylcytosine-specific restriction enzyme A